MDKPKKCSSEGCDNFAGNDGLCNACRRGEKPDTEKRKREELAAKESEERARENKKRKREENRAGLGQCGKCGGHEILALYNKAPDNNYYTLPSGADDDSGGGWTFPGLTHHEGVDMKVCVDCGTVVDFDSTAVKEAIRQAEEHL